MKKTQNILIYIIMFLAVLSIILNKYIGDLDEIWNYNFARNVSDGLVPYRDFNMLQMPLLPLICGLILKITVNELIVMRGIAAVLCGLVLFFIYKVFNILNIKKEISFVFTFFIGYLFKEIFCTDYNWSSLLFALILVYYEIKAYKENNNIFKYNIKNEIIFGVIAGCTLLFKQTSGLLICLVFLGNKLLFVRKKESLKEYVKIFLFRVIGIMIPIVILAIYLIINNAIPDFISYTIKGTKEFSNFISYNNLFRIKKVRVFAVVIPIAFVIMWYITVIKEKSKELYFLLVYGLAMFVIAFPISNEIHFYIGGAITILAIIYMLYTISEKIIKLFLKKYKNVHIKKALYVIMCFFFAMSICITLVFSFKNIIKYINLKEDYSSLNHYNFIPINRNLEIMIRNVDAYIEKSKKNVKILDAQASLYLIPLDKYNKDYDMLLKGNLGENGDKRLIDEIQKSKDTQYLILNEQYKKNWQTPLNVIEYIRENKNKIDDIGIFDVYK